MPKALGSWSAMRNYLEKEMLCDALKGRVRYSLTTYPNMDDCGHFEIFIDGYSVKTFSMDYAASKLYKNGQTAEFWKGFWNDKNKPIEERTEFDDEDFAEALREYRSISIIGAIHSQNPIIRMFAVLDRRVGKRTLLSLKESLEVQPAWLRHFYELRMESENLL